MAGEGAKGKKQEAAGNEKVRRLRISLGERVRSGSKVEWPVRESGSKARPGEARVG
jgi:hypothetical protein